MGINLQGGFGAGGAVDALRALVAERQRQQALDDQRAQEEARLAELQRQANQRHEVDLGHLGVSRETLGQRKTEFDKRFGLDVNADARADAAAARDAEKHNWQGVTFRNASQDRDDLATAVAAAPEHMRPTLNLRRLGMDVTRRDMMTPQEIGAEAGAIDLAAFNAGGREKFRQQQVIDAETRPPARLSPNQEILAINRLKTDWDKATEDYRELKRQASNMATGLAAAERGDTAAGAQAVLVTFQKILDPTSVVRESEYARSGSGQSLINRIEGWAERLAQGGAGVPVSELKAFAKVADEFVKNAESGLAGRRGRLERQATEWELNPSLIFDSDIGRPVQPPTGGGIQLGPGERMHSNGINVVKQQPDGKWIVVR